MQTLRGVHRADREYWHPHLTVETDRPGGVQKVGGASERKALRSHHHSNANSISLRPFNSYEHVLTPQRRMRDELREFADLNYGRTL
jgi:hypothetical protein